MPGINEWTLFGLTVNVDQKLDEYLMANKTSSILCVLRIYNRVSVLLHRKIGQFYVLLFYKRTELNRFDTRCLTKHNQAVYGQAGTSGFTVPHIKHRLCHEASGVVSWKEFTPSVFQNAVQLTMKLLAIIT